MSNIRPKKQLGQNYLRDQKVIDTTVQALEVEKTDRILEIGPGEGVLTRKIMASPAFEAYMGIEVDARFLPGLQTIIANHPYAEIIHADILRHDISAFRPTKVIGALPYYLTSPILHHLLGLVDRPKRLVVIIQKEVAEKILRDVPDASYWTHIFMGYTVTRVADIPPEAFFPAPKVTSTILRCDLNETEWETLQSIGLNQWSKFLHHTFRNPRKKIKHQFPVDLLEKAGIDPNLRAQHIPQESLLKLFMSIHIKN